MASVVGGPGVMRMANKKESPVERTPKLGSTSTKNRKSKPIKNTPKPNMVGGA